MVSTSFLACHLNCRVGELCTGRGRILTMRSSQPAAQARKAEGASWTALRIPNFPNPTGSVVCDQVEAPSKLMLKTALTMERSSWSKLSRHGEEKTWCSPQNVQYLEDGKRVMKQDEGIMLPKMVQPVSHDLQCLHPVGDGSIN